MKSKMVTILREIPRLTLAPLVVAVVALTLYLFGMVPANIQSPEGIREYSSLEEAESALGLEVIIPAYFPNYLFWPPVKIEGHLEPFPMTQVLFLASDQQAEALLIYQIVSDSEDSPVAFPWIETVLDEMTMPINDSVATVITGKGADGELVNGIHWMTGGVHFVVVTIHPVQELLIMARSMHP
jgi:hypothetical protein